MKLNWGTGIAVFYGIFALSLVAIVIKSTTIDHSLVSEQYYADDLNYQTQYNKLSNSLSLVQDLQVALNNAQGKVEFRFPEQVGKPAGEILFFCPSDSKSDFRVAIQPGEDNRQTVPVAGLKPGLWRVKVDWQADGKAFFKEVVITI